MPDYPDYYAIKRSPTGHYVSMQGQSHSYTRDIRLARIYSSEGAAAADLCIENETVVLVASELKGVTPNG